MRRPLGLLALGLLAIALGACGGGGGSSSKNDNAYAKLVEKGNNAKVKITYRYSDGSTSTIIQDPPKRAFLLAGDTAIYEEDSKTWVVCSNVGNADVSCSKVDSSPFFKGYAGVGDGWLTEILKTKDLPGVTLIGEKQIAGRTATCATYSLPDLGSGKVESCVDKDTGVVLLWKATDDGKTNFALEATEVSTPKASDFTPPATPSDLNSLFPTTTTN
ncbi:MAG: hypothetical protein ACOYN3_00125 [Acidimicrobiia bacterium]